MTALALALALAIGFLFLGGVLYRLGMRWLDLQERAERGELPDEAPGKKARTNPDTLKVDLERTVRMAREAPDQTARADKEAWMEERRADGYTDEEIEQQLNEREPYFVI